MASLTDIVKGLPETIPFTGPEELERRMGRRFRVRLGANESVFGISPAARDVMKQAVDRVWQYGDPDNRDLLDALAEHHRLPTDSLVLGSGIDDLLGLAVRAFLNPGDTAVASLGAYPTFLYHVAGYGARSELVPYRDAPDDPQPMVNDLVALGERARGCQAKMVYLSNPDNPTGSWHAAGELRALVDGLPDGCVLILDEAYAEFAPDEALLSPDPDDPRVIRMRTFSKAHGMAGARIGYAMAAPETISAFNRIRHHFGINRIAEEGALASLGDTAFVESVIRRVAEGRRDYERLAESHDLTTFPSATNFVSFDFGDAARAESVCEQLLQLGAFVRKSGTAPLDRCVRVTVGTEADRRLFGDLLGRAIK